MSQSRKQQPSSAPLSKAMSTLTPTRFHPYWLIIILIVYAILSLYQLDLPGLHYDEAFEAVPALQLLLDQPVSTFRRAS